MAQTHNVLLIVFPLQGHINPTLQFTKRLASLGVRVTYMTTVSTINRINKGSAFEGISFTGFTDGNVKDNMDELIYEMERCGSQALREAIAARTKEGTGFTHIIYSLLFPWVATVAREFHIPTTFLWVQTASILNIYYQYYMEGYGDFISKNIDDPSFSVELPGLPPLKSEDLPSFFLPSNQYQSAIPITRRHVEVLNEETKPRVLVNTFDALEPDALKAIQHYNMVGIGPLIPSAFLDGKNPSDTSFGGDLFKGTKDYTQWLNTKPENSVVYVSFGSLAVLEKAQKEEVAQGLLATGFPFLWVIRDSGEEEKEEEKMLSCKEELDKQGMIVPWCSQVEVLSHPSVGCFLTHCGWNSTLESLASGVPVVTVPQWADQGTNSKLVQDVWKTGIRMKKNKEGRVESDEIKRCLELVMASEEMRLHAKKWKDLAREAAMEGGSSDENLKTFVDDLGKLRGLDRVN